MDILLKILKSNPQNLESEDPVMSRCWPQPLAESRDSLKQKCGLGQKVFHILGHQQKANG